MISQNDPTLLGGAEHIKWTRSKLRKFKRAFARAVVESNNRPDATFEFEHRDFLVSFAAYLITHLDSKLK